MADMYFEAQKRYRQMERHYLMSPNKLNEQKNFLKLLINCIFYKPQMLVELFVLLFSLILDLSLPTMVEVEEEEVPVTNYPHFPHMLVDYVLMDEFDVDWQLAFDPMSIHESIVVNVDDGFDAYVAYMMK